MKTFKNPISNAMAEYREDFRYNREWWVERMGTGNNNEYLWIQFKNGDNITVQSDYFQMDGNTCLPRFRADEVAYISRYFGDQCETTTAADIVVDTDRIILYADGVEYFRYEMSETEFKEMRRQMWELDDETDSTAWMLDYCRAFATSKLNNNPDNTTPNNNDNTANTMKANNTILPAKALADLAHNQHEVIKVYSHPFTYWNGETTTEYVFIVRVKDGRLMLLSCTDIVTIPSTVCSPDDRRVYFPAAELETLVRRAEMLTKDDNTPETMNEANELSNAGYCLDVYMMNDSEIYERYTVEAIKQVVTNASVHGAFMNWGTYPLIVKDWDAVKNAIKAAVKLVKKYDHMTPTAKDIEQVTRNYVAYIVECAQYEIENA